MTRNNQINTPSRKAETATGVSKVVLFQPKSFIYLSGLVVLTLVCAILFVALVEYTRTEKVHGVLTQDQSTGSLYAVLQVSPGVLAHLKTGAEVNLVYRDFPVQVYGSHRATINSWSNTPTLIEKSTSVFEVWAVLDSQTISTNGKKLNLLPGMSLSTQISLETKTILGWVLDSFTKGDS